MTVQEVIDQLQAYVDINPRNATRELCIPTRNKGMFGPTPSVSIKSINQGIDWNSSRMFLVTDKNIVYFEENQHVTIE